MIIPINLSFLLILLFICSVKWIHLSNISPRCFRDRQVLTSALLKVKGREYLLSAFFEKITSCACLFGSGLNCIFHWKAQSLTFCKSLFSSSCEVSLLKTLEKGMCHLQKFYKLIECYLADQLCILKILVDRVQTPEFPSRSLAINNYPLITCMVIVLIRFKSFPLTP